MKSNRSPVLDAVKVGILMLEKQSWKLTEYFKTECPKQIEVEKSLNQEFLIVLNKKPIIKKFEKIYSNFPGVFTGNKIERFLKSAQPRGETGFRNANSSNDHIHIILELMDTDKE